MVLALFGESCTGKSAVAALFKSITGWKSFPGRIICTLQKQSGLSAANFKQI